MNAVNEMCSSRFTRIPRCCKLHVRAIVVHMVVCGYAVVLVLAKNMPLRVFEKRKVLGEQPSPKLFTC